jgi:hypothetical protein
VNAVAKMRKSCTVDTVNENSHTVDTVDSAMKNACKNVSYSNNSHILELNSESEAHTGQDLILESEQDRIFYIIKKMMKKFLNMRSSTKISNSVNLRQCISRNLDELNQDQIIQITNEMKFNLKIQSPTNQRDVTDEFCRRVKYGHFRSGKYGHFGPDQYDYFGSYKDKHFGFDKDEFYMPDK